MATLGLDRVRIVDHQVRLGGGDHLLHQVDLLLTLRRAHRRDRELFGLAQLMQTDRYPHPRYIGPFYAQSVSLVEFLSREKGPKVFARFLRDGLDDGYEPALKKYYDMSGFDDLQDRWRRRFGQFLVSLCKLPTMRFR